jgi:hypothetical protein
VFHSFTHAPRHARSRALTLQQALIVLICLSAALVFANSAQAAFTFSSFDSVPSTLQAGGHPNLKMSVKTDAAKGDQTGDDLKSLSIDLPAGMRLNGEAVSSANTCLATKFQTDACPPASQVGSLSVTARKLGFNFSMPGSIYKLAPEGTNIITFGFILRPSGFQRILLKSTKVTGGTTVRTGLDRDYGITLAVDGLPRVVTTTRGQTTAITIASIDATFNAKTGSTQSGAFFTFNPTRCTAATTAATVGSYAGVSSAKSVSFTPTGCAAVQFTPGAVLTPTATLAGQPSGFVANFSVNTVDAPIQQSHVRSIETTLPNGTGLNLPAIGAVPATCTDAQLNTDTCPAGSQVGSASVNAPFLPPTMTGGIYLVSRTSTLIFGVIVRGARGVKAAFKGSAYPVDTSGDGQPDTVKTDLFELPQVPFSTATLGFGPLVRQPVTGCGSPQTSKTVLTGYSGAVATVTNSYNITDCPAIPETTITSPVPGAQPNNPSFTFTSDVAAATFECSLDGAAFTPCTSPYATSPLTDGPHKFDVRAVNGPQTDASPATQSFTITTPPAFTATLSGAVSTQQAAAHPDLTSTVDIGGAGDVHALTLTLPAGLQGSAAAVPMCSQANPATCTAASAIGTQSVTATLDDNTSTTLVGTVFLTAPVNTLSAAGVLIVFPGVMAVGADVREFSNGNRQQFVFSNIPNTIGPNHIHITKIVTTLIGMTGAPAHALLTNPSLCTAPSFFAGDATPVSGPAAVFAPVPYIATGCASVPFTANASQEFSNLTASATTGVKSTVTMNVGDSAIKTVRLAEPPAIGPNFPAFGAVADQCSASAAPTGSSLFDPSSCPAQSKVGTMTVQSQLLPVPLSGPVYLINKSPLPWLGVQLQMNGIDIRLVGATSTPQVDPTCDPLTSPTGVCQTQIVTTFSNLPDQNMTNIVLDLNGPGRTGVNGPLSGDILTVAAPNDPTCTNPSHVTSVLTPITGTPAVNTSQDVTITGCP